MILVATTTRDTIPAGTVGDLMALVRQYPPDEVRFTIATGIYISNLRQQCVRLAQASRATHLLFVDADMRFPADSLECLKRIGEPIAAANYVQRTMPNWTVASVAGERLGTEPRRGLERVDSIGLGLCLIQLRVFDVIDPPWFDTPYVNGQHQGEDATFCRWVRKAGMPIWVDHDLSRRVKHGGHFELGLQEAQEMIHAS